MSNPYILIIEDDLDIQRLLLRHVRRAGFAVEVADTGEDGLALAAARAPALILLDVHLPGINGWEVLERLRASAATSQTPVLVVSIDDDPRPDAAPVAGRLAKPFQGRQLQAAVRDILGRSPVVA